MKILLAAINAKYIHSNYAVRCLRTYLESHTAFTAEIAEYTINHSIELILQELYEKKPDVLGFSCYIWNIGYVKELSLELKKLLPKLVIIWGGPEVSYDPDTVVGQYADHVICGEGETAFAQLIKQLADGRMPQPVVQGEPTELDDIPFVYPDETELPHQILYYESSRGCPFHCQYCLSSIDKRVRFQSMKRTLADFDCFLKRKVPQVKLIDRTFNCDKERTKALWRYLIEHDNGVTNFHFEIAGELLDKECLAILSKARPHYFQLEIGVQSTNQKTLREIQRSSSLTSLFSAIRTLRKQNNIHIHLDLIAGLPFEDITSFANSFNEVYRLRPHQLQLGFLKVLKGSGMEQRQSQYGIVFWDRPPYEVLHTNWLSYEDILRLKTIEDMVERYYNSGRYQASIHYLESCFASPFAFYDALAAFYRKRGLHLKAISETDSYSVLYEFMLDCCQSSENDKTRFQWLIRFDMFSHQKAKRLPQWLVCNGVTPYLDQIRHFFEAPENRSLFPEYAQEKDPRQLMRLLHLEVFPFDPRTGTEGQTALLFCYRCKDISGNASIKKVSLPLK